jgi:hypothetical protein
MLLRSFQQSSILSVILTLTFCDLLTPESQCSSTLRHKAILQGKGNSGMSYSGTNEIPAGIGEIPVSQLMQT